MALDLKPGKPLPLGATITPEGVNFSLFSQHATSCTLLLFEKTNLMPAAEIVLDPEVNRTGHIWHILVKGMDPSLGYAYQCHGPYDPQGEGHRFNKESILLDPYARALEGGEVWGETRSDILPGKGDTSFHRRCRIVVDDFD